MHAINMTQGKIIKQMLIFAWPILLGLVLQQFYNTVDAVVVGNYVDSNALAAVGSISGSLVNVVISFAFGLSAGANVLVSQYFGAEDHRNLHDVIHMEFLMVIVMGVILAVVGFICTPLLLSLVDTPPEVMPPATTYLRIYFIGLPALFIYNAGASILQAIGDSRNPLIYLIITTILNIVGDMIFVVKFGWGVAGVAWATVLAEIVSVVMVVLTMLRAQGSHRLCPKDLKWNWSLMKRIAAIGLPGGIQGTIVSLSNFAVQSYINGLGALTMAGYSASNRIDAFAQMPMQTLALVLATFVGQNLGAHQVSRARQGVKYGITLSIIITVMMSGLLILSRRPLLGLFTSDADVIENGAMFTLMMAPFYFILNGTMTLQGVLRGAGDVRFATISCVTSFVVIRQIYLYTVSRVNYTNAMVALCYPITWLIAASAITIHYLRSDWSKFEG